MAGELSKLETAIYEAQSGLFEMDKSMKSIYMLLDELQVREEQGQLSGNVVEDLSAVLQKELLGAGERITRAREIIVDSMLISEIPSSGETKLHGGR